MVVYNRITLKLSYLLSMKKGVKLSAAKYTAAVSYFLLTLDSGINIGLRLLIFDVFTGATFLLREGNAYFFSKYSLFYGMGDAYFKGYA
jgi:hypothetical protein